MKNIGAVAKRGRKYFTSKHFLRHKNGHVSVCALEEKNWTLEIFFYYVIINLRSIDWTSIYERKYLSFNIRRLSVRKFL